MPSYKDLIMSQSAYRDLLHRISIGLTADAESPPLALDHSDTGTLVVAGEYDGVRRTYEITIRDVTNGPGLPEIIEPPKGMPFTVIAMLQATIQAAWQDYDGNPTDTESFWNFLTMGDQVDVSRGTSPDSPHQKMVDFLAESDRVIAEQGLDVPRETSPHEHAHKNSGSWPTGPDGEYATLKICSCGDQVVEDSTS